MKIYRHGARAMGEHNLSCWRWSNASVEEARRLAVEALGGMVQRWKDGRELDRYAYADRPLREEIVEEFGDGSGKTDSILTRNAYGSLVLNTSEVMFIDIDLDEGALFSGLRRMFKRRSPQEAALESVRETAAKHDGMSMRVYRTFKGLRCLVTNELFDPASDDTRRILESFNSDPLYIRLCRVQECFRARLTPKHWRCGLGKPPARFPFETEEVERRYLDWQREYEDVTRGHTTCELLEIIGSGASRWGVNPVVEVHDRWACVNPGAPLA